MYAVQSDRILLIFSGNTSDSDNQVLWIDGCDYGDSLCTNYINDITVSGNTMTNVGYAGVRLLSTNGASITNNTITEASNAVFLDLDAINTTVTGNTLTNSGTAIQAENVSPNALINNNAITSADTGVSVTDGSDECTISNNTIDQVTAGFFIDQSDDCVVSDNLITLSNVNLGSGSSSPLLFTWNGQEYEYIADVGRGIPRNLVGNESNYFGLKTKVAVQAFQKANGLNPDGAVGKDTRAKMK